MKKLIIISALFISTPSIALQPTTTITYSCESHGCAIACLNGRNKWSTLSGGASEVSVKYLARGSVEYFLKKDKKNEIVFIGIERMQCKLSGIKSRINETR